MSSSTLVLSPAGAFARISPLFLPFLCVTIQLLKYQNRIVDYVHYCSCFLSLLLQHSTGLRVMHNRKTGESDKHKDFEDYPIVCPGQILNREPCLLFPLLPRISFFSKTTLAKKYAKHRRSRSTAS